ncbi:MAG: hypothetical protein KDK25_14580, partial [Leptospiraceae bacterium]|nr:hypothetical protein [Leptospiraceae bacterium]
MIPVLPLAHAIPPKWVEWIMSHLIGTDTRILCGLRKDNDAIQEVGQLTVEGWWIETWTKYWQERAEGRENHTCALLIRERHSVRISGPIYGNQIGNRKA